MARHLFEHKGVILQVDYERLEDGTPDFQSIRTLGDDYRPVGPELRFLLDGLLVVEDAPPGALECEAERFLSKIVEELPA